jgi:RimJ/RimL family protein N-acetyltransferase
LVQNNQVAGKGHNGQRRRIVESTSNGDSLIQRYADVTTDAPTISTERVVLRGWGQADVASLFAVLNAPGVLVDQPNDSVSQDDCQHLVKTYAQRWQSGVSMWAVTSIEDGEFLGAAGLHPFERYPDKADRLQLGIRLRPEAQGGGIGTDIAHAIIAYAFDRAGMSEIWTARNVGHPSGPFVSRLGFVSCETLTDTAGIVFDIGRLTPERYERVRPDRSEAVEKVTDVWER